MTAQPTPAPGIAGFDRVYGDTVLGRTFVEYQDYYVGSRPRYRAASQAVAGLGLPPGSRHLDIGGGQMALLCQKLFGFDPTVGDVTDEAARDVMGQGVGFQRLNLMDDTVGTGGPYDLITLLEVIEHIPCPPYVTLAKLGGLLRPGGWIVVSTPNFFRVRNILRMLAGREVLDIYRYPHGDEALGHQHEYTRAQMIWQFGEAGYADVSCWTYPTGWPGASRGAKLAHLLTRPFNLVSHFRDGLLATARWPGTPAKQPH